MGSSQTISLPNAASQTRYYDFKCSCRIVTPDIAAGSSSSIGPQLVYGPDTSVMSRLIADEAEMEEGEVDEVS